MKIEQLLVTTDFSDDARKAYPLAANLARKFGAKIHLAHFSGIYPTIISGLSSESFHETLEQALRNEAATHSAFENVDVVARLQRHRWTPDQLRALEHECGIDMVIMATHGRSGLKHFVLGSFAERVIRNSSAPVFVCRESEVLAEFEPKLVLVPYDFSDVSDAIIPAVRFLSSSYQCSFRFIYVYEPVPAKSFPVVESVREFLRNTPKTTIEDHFAELSNRQLLDVEVNLETCQGVPSVEIVNRARALQADLVLVGTHGVLGSVAQNVTRDVPCSVLTVPKSAIRAAT